MDGGRFILPAQDAVVIGGSDAGKLIAMKNGDAALLYIWILQSRGEFSPAEACAALGWGRERIDSALGLLAAAGLIGSVGAPADVPVSPAAPAEYTAEDVKHEMENGSAFSALVDEVQSALGRTLSPSELLKLFGVYNDLGLPLEVLMTVVGYCKSECRRRYGEKRPPTVRFIEKEAYTWERLGIYTLDRAEKHIRELENMRSATYRIKSLLGIRDRELTATEKKYVESWIEMGFDDDAISIAYDRTVIKTNQLAWAYMNSIIVSWHKKGLHTRAEIEAGDSARRTPKAPAKKSADTAAKPNKADIERLARLAREMED